MKPIEFLKAHRRENIEKLEDFLSIPSISEQWEHKEDVHRSARWVERMLREMGVETRLFETKQHPIVYGEHLGAPGAPTVLIYGHYDVQPVDPLELWDSPPFQPKQRGGYIYARGAADDKGQLLTHLLACQAHLETNGRLPVNVKFLIEGEEEASTNHLDAFIEENTELLSADVAVISDGAQYGPDMPAITFGLRGIAVLEIKVKGPDKDLHSGSFGGAVANPINVLCKLISALQDVQGKMHVDRFYKEVYTPSEWERAQYAKLPFDEKEFAASVGVKQLWGEAGYSTLERRWVRPTVDCHGITGGYQGQGIKTIIPSWASAKLSLRLVPDMDPQQTCDRVAEFLEEICPPGAELIVEKKGGAKPVQVPTDSPWLAAAAAAIEQGFGSQPFFIKEGGSIPVVETLKSVLGIDTLLIGFAQPDDNIHSPNERLAIRDFERGCDTAAALLDQLAHNPT